MKAVYDKYKRRVLFGLATFPVFGKSMFERLSSRLDRQIAIREYKRKRRYDNSTEYPEINIYNELDQLIYNEQPFSQATNLIRQKEPINLLAIR